MIGESAVIMLDGIDGGRKAPTTRVGRIVMKSNPFSFANFHASCSARVFETKYIYIQTILKKIIISKYIYYLYKDISYLRLFL